MDLNATIGMLDSTAMAEVLSNQNATWTESNLKLEPCTPGQDEKTISRRAYTHWKESVVAAFEAFPSLRELERDGNDTIRERDGMAKLKLANYANEKRYAKGSDIKEGDWVLVANKHRAHKLDPSFLKYRFEVMKREGPVLTVRSKKGWSHLQAMNQRRKAHPREQFTTKREPRDR